MDRSTEKWKLKDPIGYHTSKDIRAIRYIENLKAQVALMLGGFKCHNLKCPIPKKLIDRRTLQFSHKKKFGGARDRERLNQRRYNGDQYKMLRYYRDHPKEAKAELTIECVYCNWLHRYD